jgi:hypothetical protein
LHLDVSAISDQAVFLSSSAQFVLYTHLCGLLVGFMRDYSSCFSDGDDCQNGLDLDAGTGFAGF